MLGSDPLMARHRKRPVPRHRTPGREDGPEPEAPDRRLGSAMRRVVVTPTFAAGLGVVVAAVLAYPMQTVFSYVAPGALGRGGMLCGQRACGHQYGSTTNPAPFGVGGGVITSPATPGPGNDQPGSSGQRGGAQPRLSYKITSRWQGGFWGQIIITFPGAVPQNWKLRFGYPSGHILGMNPNSHVVANGHAAVVRSSDYAGGSGRHTFAVGVGVEGKPAHPARCSFNGETCRIH
jgi:hypothetical protein